MNKDFETKIKPILTYVGAIGAVLTSIAYVLLILVLINGFEIEQGPQVLTFAIVNGAVGLIIANLLKYQGLSFAKNLPENEEIVKAFIVGNHFGKKSETEATDEDATDEDTTDEDTTDEEATEEQKETEEQKATDTALKVAKIVKADIERRFNASREVRHILGDVNAMKYDSAAKIYRDALAKMGVNVKSLKDSECRAVFRAVSAVKVKSKDCNIKRAEKHTALDKLFNRVSVL